jgi:glycosyltransferase involved in cell wall biosynthesis
MNNTFVAELNGVATRNDNSFGRIAFIGNYLPRQCGIATFTTHLCEAIAAQYPETTCAALPVNDTENGYAYPDRVRFELDEADLITYRRAADFLNVSMIDLLCLQHEYGIFGGPAGSHILGLLREVRMPVVTTLHTILSEPNRDQRRVLQEIGERSDRLVVMSERGAQFLREIYGVSERKIDVIPHGIPDVPFIDPNFYKDQLGVEGKSVLLTFGLLSPNKGIENVINALPSILKRFPNTVYVVVGSTHPKVIRENGESYRLSLQRLARAREVEQSVIFHDRFVSSEELNEFIGAADIYLTPYLSRNQIVSGNLAYTVGAGKAVISTPYWYAEELLADGRGIIVPFGDAESIATEVCNLLDNDAERHAMRKRAYLKGREMIWPTVASLYMKSFERAREERLRSPRVTFVAKTLDRSPVELPPIKIDHLERLTDATGILQHAIFDVPNYDEGYTTDDNARALIVSTLLEEVGEDCSTARSLASRFLAFLWYAYNQKIGRFRNFLSYDRCWMEEVGSEDSHGRALWGLGAVLGHAEDTGFRGLASRLFGLSLPAVLQFSSPRAWAFTLIGLDGYLREFSGDRVAQNTRKTLVEKLLGLYKQTSCSEWLWFEDRLAYSNASLPHALLVAGRQTGRQDAVEIGLETLRWLADIQRAEEGHFVPIGSNGFYSKGGEKARFDQQPIEASAMVSACLAAFRLTLDERWRDEASRAFEWFLGRNDLGISLYDPFSGGCRDGLHADRANENQGAESSLAFLLSLLEMRLADNMANSEVYGKVYEAQTTPGTLSAAHS